MAFPETKIREVWAADLVKEFSKIASIIRDYPYISIDTEFPGDVAKYYCFPGTLEEATYQRVKMNVENTKLIQLGLTFTNKQGCLPFIDGSYSAWQFNFREFDIKKDLYIHESITMLKKCGIDFEKNHRYGINAAQFSSLFTRMVLLRGLKVQFICFHGSYDFAYLLKLVTQKSLPSTNVEFMRDLRHVFGTVYDLKYIQGNVLNIHGGLESLAKAMGIKRIGPAHQAGSDSLLTSSTFQKVKEYYLKGSCNMYSGALYGITLPIAMVF